MVAGHADRAELVEREDGEPELIVPFQHQQDHVALFDAVVGEHLGAFVGIELHLAEGEHPLLPRHVAPDHGAAVRLEAGDLVHHVVGKVEVVGDHRLKVVEHARFRQSPPCRSADKNSRDPSVVLPLVVFILHDDRKEHTVLAARRDHAVRVAGVVIDRVPRSHILGVVLHLHLELPAQDKVELLPVVLGEVDGLLLLLLRKGRGDEEGLGNLAGKAVGQVVVGEAGAAG